jgi:hypothetical protein
MFPVEMSMPRIDRPDPLAWSFGPTNARRVDRLLRRREFLAAAAATAGALGVPRMARGASPLWASAPTAQAEGLLLPEGRRAESILEVFLHGGLPQFESFYVVPEYGSPKDPDFANEQWWLWKDSHDAVFRDQCGVDPADYLMPFGTDYLGKTVNLGPLTMALRNRPDLLSRMRIMVHRHDLEPHEGAIPLALSGQRLGSSRMFGLGAGVQHYFRDRDTTGRVAPFSYVLYPETEVDKDNLRAASAVGMHPGSMRPLDIRIAAESELAAQLARASVGDKRAQFDALVNSLTASTVDRYASAKGTLRSSALEDYQFSVDAVQNADALLDILPPDVLAPLAGSSCNAAVGVDLIGMALRVATHLLTHPTTPARFVNVVDGGMIPAKGGGGYDVHAAHLEDSTRNMKGMLESLVALINEPGENDPAKIDIDKTMIILNTEFGRTPFVQPSATNSGTNHHPYGYVTVWIGGPIQEEQSGVLGAIGPDAWSDYYVTPTEARAAALVAMGMYPFSQEGFAVGDLRDMVYEIDGLAWLTEFVLGVKK